MIAYNVSIYYNNSQLIDSKERHEDFKRFLKFGFSTNIGLHENEIRILDNVWIGFGVTILKVVTIGRGTIIGANSVVTKDVPEYAVVVGNPAKIKKYTT